METKTIILSEKEGKRYELICCDEYKEYIIIGTLHLFNELIRGIERIYSGSVSEFQLLPHKEEIAERVVNKVHVGAWEDYEAPFGCFKWSPLESLMSAIGEYKYIIITEAEA